MLGRRRALAAVLVSVVMASPVAAQPKSSANRPPQEVASELVKQAIAKSQVGDHLGAIDLYLQAYQLIPQHTLLSNVGNEYQQAGKPVEALKYFCMYLDKDPTGTNATYATSKAKALQIELGNKSVDDKNACKAREPEPDPPADPPEVSGTVGLEGPKDTGTDPGGGGGGERGRLLKYAGIATAVIGAAGVGGGIYFGIKAKDRSDFVTNYSIDHPNMAWPENIKQIEADGQAYEDRQIQLLIAGGVLIVAGTVMYVIGASRASSSEKLSVRPSAAPGNVGLVLGRAF